MGRAREERLQKRGVHRGIPKRWVQCRGLLRSGMGFAFAVMACNRKRASTPHAADCSR